MNDHTYRYIVYTSRDAQIKLLTIFLFLSPYTTNLSEGK